MREAGPSGSGVGATPRADYSSLHPQGRTTTAPAEPFSAGRKDGGDEERGSKFFGAGADFVGRLSQVGRIGDVALTGAGISMSSHDEEKAFLETRVDKVVKSAMMAWIQAFRFHRCVDCAARDIEEKLEIIWEADAPCLGECLEFCEDASMVVRAVGPREVVGCGGVSVIGPPKAKAADLRLLLDISVCLGQAWDAAILMLGCKDCARALIRAQVRKFGDEARAHIPVGSGRQGYRRVCKRCRTDVQGLV